MTREQAIAKIMAVWPAQQLSTGRDVLAQRLVAALEALDLIALETSESRFGTTGAPSGQPYANEAPEPEYIGKRDRT